MNDHEYDALVYARFSAALVGWTEHMLYCIGGKLDGQIKNAMGFWFFAYDENRSHLWMPGFNDDDRPRREIRYELKRFDNGGHQVSFWVLEGFPADLVERRARELFTDAAVLQDEQLICK